MLSVSAQIAHIRSESPAGPRYDPTYPVELVDQEENLLLLCGIHHKPVDDHASIYPVKELLDWKRQQISSRSSGGLSEHQVADIIRHYDLNSLEPMAFEMLCQALTVRRFGSRTVIHGGYGRDGGKDASFEGRLADYPSAEMPWDGYIVMQAMFKVSNSNSPAAATWMREKVRHDARRRAEGKPADFLVVATNVSIRAAFGPSGMSRLDDVIRQHSGRSLKGWVIWDEAELLGMLNAYTDVKDAFTPLMSARRLAVEFMESLKPLPV